MRRTLLLNHEFFCDEQIKIHCMALVDYFLWCFFVILELDRPVPFYYMEYNQDILCSKEENV